MKVTSIYKQHNGYEWYLEKQNNTEDYKFLRKAYKGLNNVWKMRPKPAGAILDEYPN